MTCRRDGRAGTLSPASKVAHVIERVGLALAGALCGLFVASLLARADMEMLGPVDLALAMMLLGIIGFYLGIDMPMRPLRGGFRNIEPGPKLDFAELFSAFGVFLATATALVSVYVVVFDGTLPAIWVFGVGGLWLSGAAMQIVAGVMARLRGYDRGLGRAPLRGSHRTLPNSKSANMLGS
jgi:Na+-driven multidrug efflux pump